MMYVCGTKEPLRSLFLMEINEVIVVNVAFLFRIGTSIVDSLFYYEENKISTK